MEIRINIEEYGTLEVGLAAPISGATPNIRVRMVDAVEPEDGFEFILSPKELDDLIYGLGIIRDRNV